VERFQPAIQGIVSGFIDGSFRPDQKITRTEMTVMLVRAMSKIYGTTIPSHTTTFEDNKDIPQWATSEVAAAVKVGIVQGNDGNKFLSNAVATRAEAVARHSKIIALSHYCDKYFTQKNRA
jgi:hypothetical protein